MNRILKLAVILIGVSSITFLNTGCRRKKPTTSLDPVVDAGLTSVDTGMPSDISSVPFDSTGANALGDRANANFQVIPGLEPVYFDYDRSDLRGSEAIKLDNAAAYFRQNTTLFVLVEGHTDERGSNEYNLGLGERRALAIRDGLIQRGVEAIRIQTLSKGEEFPAATGHDESAWSRNRRGEFLAGQ